MRRSLLLLALAGCAHAPSLATSPEPTPEARVAHLRELEQRRSLGGGEVVAASRDADPRVRHTAFEVLARLQRPETVDAVLAGLADPATQEDAAFAAGQLGMAWQPLPDADLKRLAQGVEKALQGSPALPVRVASLNALGKLAQPGTEAPVVAALADADAGVRREAAQALGILAYRSKGAAPGLVAIDPLASLLAHDANAEVRYAAGYALMRMKKPEARPGLTFGLKDGDPSVRAVCARGLGDVGTDPELPYLIERLDDADLQVRAESARALGKLAAKCSGTPCKAADAAARALEHLATAFHPERSETALPLLALVQESLPPALANPLVRTAGSLPPAIGDATHARAIVACYIAAAADHFRTDGLTPTLAACRPTPELENWRVALAVKTVGGAVAEAKLRAAMLLKAQVSSPLAAGAVDDALGELKVDGPEIRSRLLRDLRSPDWGVTLSAADAAGKLGMAEAAPLLLRALTVAEVNEQHDAMATILGHLATLKAPHAVEVAQRYARDARPTVRAGALEALKTLGVATPAGEPAPAERLFPRSARTRVARVVTDRGEMRLELAADSLTAENFVRLAERGYFDTLTFHRVVPAFVIQGGDPRGDGSGGPGYSIPCEIDRSRYVRGAVGMALAGKDTGGSQFFVTLTPQPHLEGRYAIFGKVLSGMDVADRIVEGDRIVSVMMEP